MPAAEGEFPKAAQDILYASEANRFNNFGGILFGSGAAVAGSATAAVTLGSILVPAGSILFPYGYLDIRYRTSGGHNASIFISGTGNNYRVRMGSVAVGGEGATMMGHGQVPIMKDGTHASQFIYGISSTDNLVESGTTIYMAQDINIANLNPGSAFVIYFEMTHAHASAHRYQFFQVNWKPGIT